MTNKNNKKGFTLIETFVAITVLVIAVLGPMTLLSRALQDSRYIKDEVTATFLAQEGVELVINDRNQGSNLSGNNYSCVAPDYYRLDDTGNTGYNCSSVPGAVGVKTSFHRTVTVGPVIDDSGVSRPEQQEINSLVTFSTGNSSKTVEAYSIIFK